MTRRAVDGIELEVAEHGPADGPLVVLLHGFPELGFSWRHQVPALTEAGYRLLVPDLRGFGGSDAPEDVSQLAVHHHVEDVVGLIGDDTAVVVGHDWGADVAWKTAWTRPERVRAVAGLSVPFLPPAPRPPTELLPEDFYMRWLAGPDSEAALSRDVRRTLATPKVWNAGWAADTTEDPPTPPFMTDEELRVYVDSYERTGFRGGLGIYRNLDADWEHNRAFADRRIEQPALFLTGERDPVRKFAPPEAMTGWVTDLRDVVVVPGAGHWVNQQDPTAVNAALLRFLAGL